MRKHWILAAAPAAVFLGCSQAPEPAPSSTEAPAESAAAAPVGDEGGYAPTGVIAGTLPEISAALAAGETTSEALVEAYLDRIERIDWSGPTLQSVLSVNPNALADARASDARRASGGALGPLDGVPILLKDNIESLDPIATTAGALALKDNVTGRDSPLVAGLRAGGAVILGKTNLSQWANFRSNDSTSGWTALGGQVRNPHLLDRSPCGSSSGSGAAAAASLAAGTVGTETNGSIICPSTINGVVGFKPTVGLVSAQYIIPISSSQDTAGPMTKSVEGAAMLMNAMATGDAKTDYVAALDANSLQGARIGVARFAVGEYKPIIDLFEAALEDLEAAGAVLVEIKEFNPGEGIADYPRKSRNISRYEFKATVNHYLSEAAPAVETRDLDALIAFNKAHADIELALFDQSIFEETAPLADVSDPTFVAERAEVQNAVRSGLDKLLADNNVSAIVAPSGPLASRIDPLQGDVWPPFPGAGSFAAVAGYPHLTVPMGAYRSLPVGLSFIGGKDQDARILSLGYAYEQKTKRRVEPRYLKDGEEIPEIAAAMRRKAD